MYRKLLTHRIVASVSAVLTVGCGLSLDAPALAKQQQQVKNSPPAIVSSVFDTIGNTHLVEVGSLSAATGCRILLKCEHMNPAGSVKDRPAAFIIAEAEREGRLIPPGPGRDAAGAWRARGGTIVEGSGGNTGVALALLGAARGYRVLLTMPVNVSSEKVDCARAMGAEVTLCPQVAFLDERHYYQRAKALVEATPGAVWGNQFEGLANRSAHVAGTGPEIWEQTGGRVDAFCCAAGTGGTLAGVGAFLRSVSPAVRLYLIDPPSSSLLAWVNTGTLAASPGTTITEGIGIGRLTANFLSAPPLNGAFQGTDQEAIDMAHYLLAREGIWVGPSAALNVCGAVKAARLLGPGHTVVTVLCDGGAKYSSKVFNKQWMEERGLRVSPNIDVSRDNADFVL